MPRQCSIRAIQQQAFQSCYNLSSYIDNIIKALDEARLTLRAIVNTDHHADHMGGNDYLARNVVSRATGRPTRLPPELRAALG